MLAQGRGRWSVSQRPKFVNIASELSVALIRNFFKKKTILKKKLMYAFLYKVIIVTMHVSSVHKSRSGTSVFDSTNKNLLSLNRISLLRFRIHVDSEFLTARIQEPVD